MPGNIEGVRKMYNELYRSPQHEYTTLFWIDAKIFKDLIPTKMT